VFRPGAEAEAAAPEAAAPVPAGAAPVELAVEPGWARADGGRAQAAGGPTAGALWKALHAVGRHLEPDALLASLLEELERHAALRESAAALVRPDGTLHVRARRGRDSGRGGVLGALARGAASAKAALALPAAVAVPIAAQGEVRAVVAAAWDRAAPPAEREWVGALALGSEAALANALRLRSLQEDSDRLVRRGRAVTQIVGVGKPTRELVEMTDRCAGFDVDVLILGETGTGKELVARRIHERSRRRAGPFVGLDCNTVPVTLFESELFGHVKGSFTGADADREGKVAAAEGGTLFLDEIGDLPAELQGKLLRLLEDRSYTRLGENRPRRADVRIVAATNKDLAAPAGMRLDLVKRLGVPLRTTPLRERMDDLALLAYFLLDGLAEAMGKPVRAISGAVLEELRRYAWPGNVRELRQCLRNALIFCGDSIESGDLRCNPEIAAAGDGELPTLEQLEREHLARVLHATGGNQARAARILGLHENTIRLKMRQFGLEKHLFQTEPPPSASPGPETLA
jgi:DNA-binding NtrC family response regulator